MEFGFRSSLLALRHSEHPHLPAWVLHKQPGAAVGPFDVVANPGHAPNQDDYNIIVGSMRTLAVH